MPERPPQMIDVDVPWCRLRRAILQLDLVSASSDAFVSMVASMGSGGVAGPCRSKGD